MVELTFVHVSCLQLAQANILLHVCFMSYDYVIKTWQYVYFILIVKARQQLRTVPLAPCAILHGSFPSLAQCARPPRKPTGKLLLGAAAMFL